MRNPLRAAAASGRPWRWSSVPCLHPSCGTSSPRRPPLGCAADRWGWSATTTSPRGDHVPEAGRQSRWLLQPAGFWPRARKGGTFRPGKPFSRPGTSGAPPREEARAHVDAREARAPASLPPGAGDSVLVHAALVAWLLQTLKTAPAGPRLRPATRITLRPLPPRPPAKDHHRPPTTPSPHRPGAPSGSATASRPSSPSEPTPAPPASAPVPRTPSPDAPIQLFPGGAVAHGAGPVPPPDTGASTARDVPDSPAVEGKRVLERVETMRRDSLAERLVATGVDDYFKDYRRALQSHMGTPPPGGGPKRGPHRRTAVNQRLARRAGGGQLRR